MTRGASASSVYSHGSNNSKLNYSAASSQGGVPSRDSSQSAQSPFISGAQQKEQPALSMQDLTSKKAEPAKNGRDAQPKHQPAAQTSGARLGERKNSLGGTSSSQQVMGEISNTHTIGRSVGVRGSVEIKSISTVGGVQNGLTHQSWS